MSEEIVEEDSERVKQFKLNCHSHAKLSCKKCYGRGFVQISIPPSSKLGILNTIIYKDYCICVKKNMEHTHSKQERHRKAAEEPIEVFTGLQEYRTAYEQTQKKTANS